MERRDILLAALTATLPFPALARTLISVTQTGARGDGVTLDTHAINAAIAAAAKAGGGVVHFPRGRYLSFTIRLASRVSILFEDGAVLEAADPARHPGRYDSAEDRGPQLYQDFGHSHWHNSLICGDGVEDLTISGPGLIAAEALTRNGPGARWQRQTGERPLSMQAMSAAQIASLEGDDAAMAGLGDKAISLRAGSRIRLADFTIRGGGHIAVLATGTRGLEIENLTIDGPRDGIDLDAVQNTNVRGCRINTPNDDAIVIKSSLALGRAVPARQITISNCQVSGFDEGTMLDGTRTARQKLAPDRDRATGRIKLGTESNGGYRDILIERCQFAHCRGLALETVDGGAMENVTARDLVMRDVTTAPLFVRIGARQRGPRGTGVGSTKGILLQDIEASGIDHRYPAILAGIAGHPVQGIAIERVHLSFRGGGTAQDAARKPPSVPSAYPEPSMFGVLPAWGLWARHVRGLRADRLTLETETPDARPPILCSDVTAANVTHTPHWPRQSA